MKIYELLHSRANPALPPPPKTKWLIHVDNRPWGQLHKNYKSFREAIATASKEGKFPQEAQITVKRVPADMIPAIDWRAIFAKAWELLERWAENRAEAKRRNRRRGYRYWKPPPKRRRSRTYRVRTIRVRG
jgi:hypothetical protein